MIARQGHTYIGGASVPFIVSHAMIKDGAQNLGFDQVVVTDREDFPLSFLPPIPPGTQDDWDTIVIGRRVAPDGDVSVPDGVRWLVDVTPALPASPPAAQSMPSPQVPPTDLQPSWAAAVFPERDVPSVGAPFTPIPDIKMPLIVGIGVIGGLFFGKKAVDHLFREGMTWEEKKNILIFSGTILGIYAAVNLLGLDEKWFEPEKWPGIVEEHVQP